MEKSSSIKFKVDLKIEDDDDISIEGFTPRDKDVTAPGETSANKTALGTTVTVNKTQTFPTDGKNLKKFESNSM